MKNKIYTSLFKLHQIALLCFVLVACTTPVTPTASPEPLRFDGGEALQLVETQVSFGPRVIGTEAHAKAVDWISSTLQAFGWDTDIQEEPAQPPIQNIVARRGEGRPWILIGAHYDSRLVADRDPDPNSRSKPVPGANDGASGVAVLLELARVLPKDLNKQIWLVFFDAEDNGSIPGMNTDWIMGSRAFAQDWMNLPAGEKPDAVVIVDMIGDADLNIHYERNSNVELSQEIWQIAAGLGYQEQFIQDTKYSIIDDHTPFLEAGIPAVDIIDFDYPFWHTTQDTLDKISAESLQAVGDTLFAWLQGD
jgi:Zn-dependent M28 family amino/carboxypeptidase